MAKHSADDTAMATVAAGNVMKKAEFFSRIMTNVNPSVFPRKLKKSSESSEKNTPSVDLSVDNTETGKRNAMSSRKICDGPTFESNVACPCVLERQSGVSEVITTLGTDIHGQIQTKLTTSGDDPDCGDFPSNQLIQVNEKNKDSLNKEDSLHCFSEHAIINEASEEQPITRKGDFKDGANQETVPESSTPLDQVDKACQVVSMEHLCGRGNKVSEACCITQACQTSFTGMYHKYGATAESDSDSDLWVKSRLIAIQEKIHRRRARLAYSISSDESSGDERFSLSRQQSADSRYVVNHEGTSGEADVFTGSPDKENIHFVNSKAHKNHSQNSGLAVKKAGIAEQKIKELQHFTINRDSHNERQSKESLNLPESCLKKKKLKSKSHGFSPKLVNSTARQQCDDLISTNCGENKAEVNASKRSCPEMPFLQVSVVSTVPNSHKKKSSSKSSEKGSDDCVDNSRVNIDCKGRANLCEVSAKKYKPPKKTKNSTSSHGFETSVDDRYGHLIMKT